MVCFLNNGRSLVQLVISSFLLAIKPSMVIAAIKMISEGISNGDYLGSYPGFLGIYKSVTVPSKTSAALAKVSPRVG